jgi:hypothetical protein
MFEYIFPIFCFGVVITAIVAKGMMTAADVAGKHRDLGQKWPALSSTGILRYVGHSGNRQQSRPVL